MPTDSEYERAVPLMRSMVAAFARQYPIDADDAWSEACLGFVRAATSFDPTRGAEWTTWVGYKVKKALQSLLRRRIEQARGTVPLDREPEDPRGERFDADYFLASLGEDARELVRAAFAPPLDVRVSMAEMGCETVTNLRTALRIFFRDSGWSQARVDAAFKEVRSKL